MATTLTPVKLSSNGSAADPAGTALTSADVGTITNAEPELTVFRVVNGATAGNFVVKAGTLPLAVASGQGDLTVAAAGSATVWVGPVESGRFLQNDGTLNVAVTQNMTVTAFRVARH